MHMVAQSSEPCIDAKSVDTAQAKSKVQIAIGQ